MKRASSVENSYYIDVYIVGLSASQGKQVYCRSLGIIL
jgi:hypothetical protein